MTLTRLSHSSSDYLCRHLLPFLRSTPHKHTCHLSPVIIHLHHHALVTESHYVNQLRGSRIFYTEFHSRTRTVISLRGFRLYQWVVPVTRSMSPPRISASLMSRSLFILSQPYSRSLTADVGTASVNTSQGVHDYL